MATEIEKRIPLADKYGIAVRIEGRDEGECDFAVDLLNDMFVRAEEKRCAGSFKGGEYRYSPVSGGRLGLNVVDLPSECPYTGIQIEVVTCRNYMGFYFRTKVYGTKSKTLAKSTWRMVKGGNYLSA